MRASSSGALVFVLLSGAMGCGGVTSAVSTDAGGAPSDATPSQTDAPATDAPTTEARITQACAAVAKAECDKRVACSSKINPTGVGVIRLFGTMAECLTREALLCTTSFRAPGSGHSLATEQECVDAYAAYSCADFFSGDVPVACQPAGSHLNGAACAYNVQCKSGFCTGEKNALCGTCGPTPAIGASCADSDCGRGQICDGTTTTCLKVGAAGDSCDSGDDCGYALVCPTSGGTRTCQTTLSDLGAACGGSMPVCDGTQGLFCGSSMGAKTCIATTFVGDGAPCGLVSQDSFVGCTAGACYTAKGVAGQGETGICKTNAADGAACDTVTGPACEVPARCILGDGTTGVCRVPAGTCG